MKLSRPPRPARTTGMTLVEVMVALTLGALIVLVCGALLVFSNNSYQNQVEATRLNDYGLYAHEIVTRAIRQTAFVDWDAAPPLLAQADDSASISGLDNHSVTRAGAGIGSPVGGAVNGSDVLAVRYSGSGVGADGDGSVINCAGFGVARAATEAERGWSIFYVAADASGEAELRCKYRGDSGWGADAIVRGVDTFQVLYGLDTDVPADGVPNQYLNASAIDALDDALVLVGADADALARDKRIKTHWKRVVSLKIALLLHGERGSAPADAAGRFDMFGPAYTDAHALRDPGVRFDEATLAPELRNRARHLVTWPILLRNRP